MRKFQKSIRLKQYDDKNQRQIIYPEMSDQIIERLKNKNFTDYYEHVKLEGGHIAPLEHFKIVYDFLEKHLPTE